MRLQNLGESFMDKKLDLVQKWLSKADLDLLTAERLLSFSEEPTIETICFHCQQAVEKYIKAFLIFKEKDFKKVHEIGYLLAIAKEVDGDFEQITDAETLTDFAVEVRYPEALYYELPDEEAHLAFEIAKRVKEFVLKKINISQNGI